MESIRFHCKDSINRLLSDQSVKSAVLDEFEKRLFSFLSKSSQKQIFDELTDLFYIVAEFADVRFTLKDPVGKSSGKSNSRFMVYIQIIEVSI